MFLLFAHKGDRLIATGQDHAASVFDLAHSPVSTKPVFSTPPMAGSDLEVVLALALVDGERALASVSSRYQISLWSLSDGSPRGRIQADGQISGMTPDAEAQRLAIREESEVDVWDSATQRPLWRGLSHGREVADAQFSPDGAWLATGSEDRKLRLWRLPFRISSDRRSRYGVRANLVVPLLRVLR